jgi:oligoribonuclease
MSETDKSDRLVWVDLETTGLDPARHAILEVAVIVTNGDLRPVAEPLVRLVYPGAGALENMDPTARAMHEESELLDELRARYEQNWFFSGGGCLGHSAAEAEVLEYLQEHVNEREAPLAGSSVHFDRAFLARHMPRVHAHLHYRNLDVSSLLEAARRWTPRIAENAPTKRELHRALPDLEDSLTLARYLRDAMWLRGLNERVRCEGHVLTRQTPTTLGEAIDACAAAPEHEGRTCGGCRHHGSGQRISLPVSVCRHSDMEDRPEVADGASPPPWCPGFEPREEEYEAE